MALINNWLVDWFVPWSLESFLRGPGVPPDPKNTVKYLPAGVIAAFTCRVTELNVLSAMSSELVASVTSERGTALTRVASERLTTDASVLTWITLTVS